ncbi:MAG: hypothetical protein KF824_00315 [Fimbriimonadaceae bacterium]|nr:MAG: hypothetical protein KF824_00315 [Fimbriimonadaceae bacterium]
MVPDNKGEIQLVQAVNNGEEADISNLAKADRTIRPEFLRALMQDRVVGATIEAAGIRLKGARFNVELDLSNIDTNFPLSLTHCTFVGTVNLLETGFRTLTLDDSIFEEWVDAGHMELRGDFSAKRAEFKDWLCLHSAEIRGDCCLSGASLTSKTVCYGQAGLALRAARCEIDGVLFTDVLGHSDGGQRFSARGTVNLIGAKISGGWVCSGGSFEGTEFQNVGKVAIAFDFLESGGPIQMRVYDGHRFRAEGTVHLLGAKIGGDWDCTGGSFDGNGEAAIVATNIDVRGDVLMRQYNGPRFKAAGTVNLMSAKVDCGWDCTGGSFDGNGEAAIVATNIDVRGGVFMGEYGGSQFEAVGTVNLMSAKIGDDWDCTGGSFDGKGEAAIMAPGFDIGGSLLMRENESPRFEAVGTVNLMGARIGGDWECQGAQFSNAWRSIIGDRLVVAGKTYLGATWSTTSVNGMISFERSHFKGNWDCHLTSNTEYGFPNIFAPGLKVDGDATLVVNHKNAPNTMPSARVWDFQGIAVVGVFKTEIIEQVALDLTGASVGTLNLTPPTTAEMAARWKINGLRYQAVFEPDKADELPMLTLLENSDEGRYLPQPYRQLFRVLKDGGHSEQATEVVIRMHEHRHIQKINNSPKFLLRLFYEICYSLSRWAGHGYKPRKLFVWSVMIWILGSIIFSWVAIAHPIMIVPTLDATFNQQGVKPGQLPLGYPGFSGPMYALDQFLPIINFGQVDMFHFRVDAPPGQFNWFGWGLTALNWFLTAAGWILTTLFAGSVSGLMRRVDADQ